MRAEFFDDPDGLLKAVLHTLSGSDDARLAEITACFVRCAHAFVREAALTETEYHAGLSFITALGQQTNARHNEVVLAADVLGISTLVTLINDDQSKGKSASALLGPFYRRNSPIRAAGDSIIDSPTPGQLLAVNGCVNDIFGAPIANALIDVWQASPSGLYENQDETQADMNLRGAFRSDHDGQFSFQTVVPAGYPVPTHGVVGDLLRRQHRSPMRPAHLHFVVAAPGYNTLITQIFLASDEELAADVVFGARRALIAKTDEVKEPSPDWPGLTPPFATLKQDFILQAGQSVLPEAPIE